MEVTEIYISLVRGTASLTLDGDIKLFKELLDVFCEAIGELLIRDTSSPSAEDFSSEVADVPS